MEDLNESEYDVVAEIHDRVSTRLSTEDQDYPPPARRELTKKLIRDEYQQWQLQQANRGRPPLQSEVEDRIFAAVLARLDGLGRFAPLLARGDVEDIHFEGDKPTMLRLRTGELVPGPPIASSDKELLDLLRTIGARTEDGQTSRELSYANPVLNIRLKGVTELGARLQASMDVLPRPAGVIRVHRFSDPSLADLRSMGMIDSPMEAFLHFAVQAKASTLISGNPGVGKTTFMRSLGNAIVWANIVVLVEDERELGLHLPRRDGGERFAVVRTFESRLPNAEGKGGFGMGPVLHEALRISPTWCLLGEVRGGYVIHLLDAVTSGISKIMCTIHSPDAEGIFDKVLINALKATPPPSETLVLRSMSALDLVVHIERDDRTWERYVSGIYELGPVGDSGLPAMVPIFDPRPGDRRGVACGAGALSPALKERLEVVGFDADEWLDPVRSDWDQVLEDMRRTR
jgi:Flp pilus assembly CpaF family ATPase